MVAKKAAPTRSYRADLWSGLDSGVRLLGDDCTQSVVSIARLLQELPQGGPILLCMDGTLVVIQ